jgi:uncharacterized membrane protein YheB (UPF0754 family)
VNKSLATNLIALIITLVAYYLQQTTLFSVGIFALSGAVTNWLAVHMLFEKVPGLYGSGVIPARFEEFKLGIRHLMMDQFFTEDNIDRFLNRDKVKNPDQHLAAVITKLNLDSAFDSLLKTILESSFGGMLSMMGGTEAIKPLKQPFIDNLRTTMIEITASEEFSHILIEELEQPDVIADIRQSVEEIIDKRLNELTPQLVKAIIQEMIRSHLGWLVVWGGVFGGSIGLIGSLLKIF